MNAEEPLGEPLPWPFAHSCAPLEHPRRREARTLPEESERIVAQHEAIVRLERQRAGKAPVREGGQARRILR